MSCEFSIARKPFLEILKRSKVLKKLGKRNLRNERVEFDVRENELTISVGNAMYSIPAEGEGNYHGTALIPLLKYQALQKIPPIQNPIRVVIDTAAGKLIIGTTQFQVVDD